MNTDTPRTNRFYASFADGECIPNQDEWLALCESLESELTAVTEQRDRLAEALERILDYQGRFAEEEPESIATEALQYLNQSPNNA